MANKDSLLELEYEIEIAESDVPIPHSFDNKIPFRFVYPNAEERERAIEKEYERYGETRENREELYWNEEKKLWLAKISGEYLEGYERGSQLFLPYSDEFTLNLSACRKILEVYKIPETKVNLSDVPKLSPSELEKLALNLPCFA